VLEGTCYTSDAQTGALESIGRTAPIVHGLISVNFVNEGTEVLVSCPATNELYVGSCLLLFASDPPLATITQSIPGRSCLPKSAQIECEVFLIMLAPAYTSLQGSHCHVKQRY
jgi:hypothetical protein